MINAGMNANELLVTSAAAVATTAAVVWYAKRKYRKEEVRAIKRDGSYQLSEHFVELNDFEQASITRMPAPTTTLTWLNLSGNGDHKQLAALLKARVYEILQANPWLCGKFAKQSNGKYAIRYTDQVSSTDVDRLLFLVEPSRTSLHVGTPMDQLSDLCLEGRLILEFRKDLQQPFWRIALVPDCQNPNERCALVVSMSHVVGDGHTFYRIHNMLLGGEPVLPLDATRVANTNKLAKEALGDVESKILDGNLGTLFSLIRGIILTMLVGPYLLRTKKYSATSRYFFVDSAKIATLKKHYKSQCNTEEDVPFISTNDIIASWYFANCNAANGVMAINYRGRLAGHTDKHAGNYENLLYYRIPRDADTPELIRKSLSPLKRTVTADEPMGFRELAFQSFAMCTNWTTFVSITIDLAGCQPLVHFPIYDIEKVVPSTLSLCVIFQARPNQIAVMLGGTEEILSSLSKAPFESNAAFFL